MKKDYIGLTQIFLPNQGQETWINQSQLCIILGRRLGLNLTTSVWEDGRHKSAFKTFRYPRGGKIKLINKIIDISRQNLNEYLETLNLAPMEFYELPGFKVNFKKSELANDRVLRQYF